MASVTEFRNEITAALQAHVPIVIVESYEWERVEGMLCGITRKEGITYLKATAERGLRLFDTDKKRFTSDDPLIADQHDWSIDNIVRWVRDELEGDVLLHIEDFHHNFKEKNWRQGITLTQEPTPHSIMGVCWLLARVGANETSTRQNSLDQWSNSDGIWRP